MKIIGSQAAATVLVLPLDDVRPIQGIAPQQIIDVLAPRYKFVTRPRATGTSPLLGRFPINIAGTSASAASPQMLFQMSLTLQNGMATVGERKILITRLDVFPDVSRIVVQTITTDEGDIVLDDISSVLEGACGFRNLKEFATRQYLSNCIIQFEKSIEEYVSTLGAIQKIIGPALKAATGIDHEPQIERIGFAFDPMLLPASKAQTLGFVLERRIESPFSENRYLSGAPLRTNDHLQVLEQIGGVLEGKR
jgi:hypothetical protein